VPDSPSRIVNIGLPAKRRNFRRTSCRLDFQIRILNNGAWVYPRVRVATLSNPHFEQ
jgi:hypothetical protein